MDARTLEIFLEIVATGTFREAAKRTGLSQPSLTARIRRLEDELGFALFDRSPGGVVLTGRGKRFLPHARLAVDALARARTSAEPIRDGNDGHLRIGYTAVAALSVAPQLIRAVRRDHDGISLELKEMTSSPIEAALSDGSLDAGILHPPVSEDGLSLLSLDQFGFVAVTTRDDPLSEAARPALADLADRPFVMVARSIGPYVFDKLVGECMGAGFHPNIVQEVQTSISVLGMVAAGAGVGLVVEPLAQFAHPELAFVPLTGLSHRLDFCLAWRAERPHFLVDVLQAAAETIRSQRPLAAG